MAFSDWDSYTDLLDKLADAESDWGDASDYQEFDQKVRDKCAALVPNSGGYDDLVTRLAESGDYTDNDKLFEHLRIVILAATANVAELGEDWTGYWISRDSDDAEIYAESRTAAVSAWAPVDDTADTDDTDDPPADDDVEEIEPAADTDEQDVQQVLDADTGRWRRYSVEDQAYEYYEQDDDVWERIEGELWSRYHDGAQQWLPYDGPSQTWLYEDVWVAYEQVGASATEPDLSTPDDDEDLDVLAERLVAETLAELDEEIEPLSDDERAEAIAEVRRELAKERAQ